MPLSTPVYRLKHRAKLMAARDGTPLHQALNKIAKSEGYTNWSLLARDAKDAASATGVLRKFNAGDLVLLAARPRQGKTVFGLTLLVEALRVGRAGAFFSLECNEDDVVDFMRASGVAPQGQRGKLALDCSDAITADYIIEKMAQTEPGSVIVIDYLQALDQRRTNAGLAEQVQGLKTFAARKDVVVVLMSQIDRAFEASGRPLPDLRDVRLPNAIDLNLFNKACFLNKGRMRVDAMA